MSYFETEQSVVSNQYLWCEKYRPQRLEDYICDNQLRSILQNFVNQKTIGRLLFYGSAGTGKTTLAKLLTSLIPCDSMYVNASDNTGIDFIRDKIKPFAASSGFNDLKVVILDEADFISTNGQASLRNLMETYSQSTRFILTCNYPEKIIEPLISRCQSFKIEPPTKKDVALYAKSILDKESVKYDLESLKKVINSFYPDIRKIINVLQQNSTDGELKLLEDQSENFNLKSQIVDLLKKSKQSTNSFSEIRQLVNDAGTRIFEELYNELYSKVDEYAVNKQLEIIICISEHIYQSSMVVDKEITFMACIAKIIKLLK